MLGRVMIVLLGFPEKRLISTINCYYATNM
jgi:hypothetical protein